VRQIASTCPARLNTVAVKLFEKVTEGQTLAILNGVLDDEQPREQLQAQLDTSAAEIEHLLAQLVPIQDNLDAEKNDRIATHISDARRFSVDVENAKLEILRLTAVIETDKITLGDLALDVKITQELVDKQAVAPYELQKIQTQHSALAKSIEENERLLEQAKVALEQAQQRQEQYSRNEPYHPSAEGALDVIRKEITVQEQRMNELLVQLESMKSRQALTLRAPFDGVVSQVLHRQTEVVPAGEPILAITDANVTDIVAYATETQMSQITKGTPVELIKNIGPAKIQIERSTVTYVGPTIEQIPAQLWKNPNVPQWGRPFLVRAPKQMKLIIGETVGIRRLRTPKI
jgi:multidrug resistance efflux pump